MSDLDTGNESCDSGVNGSLETSMELMDFQNDTNLNNLKSEIQEKQRAGKVEYIRDSNDKKYKVYSYIVKEWAFPDGVKHQAIKQLNLKNHTGIEITDKDGEEYNNYKKFKKGEKVYIRVKIEEGNSRDSEDYFDCNKKVETDDTYKDKGIRLKRDVGMSFYVMQMSDVKRDTSGKVSRTETIKHLINKLGSIKEFAYLKRDEYSPTNTNVTQTFNIRPDFAQYLAKYPNSYFIPIPMDSEKRKIEDKKFKSYAKSGIDEICKRVEPYGKYWKGIKDRSKLAAFFTAIAKVETGKTNQKIGTDEYHRRETGSHNCFSFGPHHILMEGPGKRAYNNLKNAGYFSTEGQTYHPKNATMRCMGFIVEKLKDIRVEDAEISNKICDVLSFFDKKNITGDDFRKFATIYNGSGYAQNNYHNKFAQAYNILK